jgi:hypothetical protein
VRRVLLVLATILIAVSMPLASRRTHSSRAAAPATVRLPELMLWAWERPVDLRELGPGAGVAFLAQTITVSPDAFVASPRRQPLLVNPGTPLIAVTRIEAPGGVPSSARRIDEMARAIATTSALPGVAGIQIDFDATRSQREMYRRLLFAVRAAMPYGTPLSMTALASWCTDDDWLDDLPIDEAVPRLFRMGPSEGTMRASFAKRLHAPACRGVVGTSLDELRPVVPAHRTYVFNTQPWTAAAIAAARRRVTP